MLTVRIIPCLDVKDGRVVKGIQFGNLRDAGSPVELAAAYEAMGADELVVLDIAATPTGREHRIDVIRAIRKQLSIPLTVGGGVRNVEDAETLLMAGADKVGINTAAVTNPSILTDVATRFGRQCTVLALDAARSNGNGWEVLIRSGSQRTGIDAVSWAREAANAGAGEILLTSWDRDGSLAGYDCELLRTISSAVSIPIIASGGASSPDDIVEAVKAGADAVLAASIFHFGKYSIRDIKEALARDGKDVRI
jgi:imidazole glycerol-phosphate synthase subunit HisF